MLRPWLKAAVIGTTLPFFYVAAVIGIGRTLPCYGWACLGTYSLAIWIAAVLGLALSIMLLRAAKEPHLIAVTAIGAAAFYASESYYFTALNPQSDLPGLAIVAAIATVGFVVYSFASAVLPRLTKRQRLISTLALTATLVLAGFIIARHRGLYNGSITPAPATPNPFQFNNIKTAYKPSYIPAGYTYSGETRNDNFEKDYTYTLANPKNQLTIGENRANQSIATECSQQAGQSCAVVGHLPDGTAIYEVLPYQGELFVHIGDVEVRLNQDWPWPLSIVEAVKMLQSLRTG